MKNTLLFKAVIAFSFFVLHFSFAFGQLSGTYTIDPSGSGSKNYTSFTKALTDLTNFGISGPVVFNIADGTYSDSIILSKVSGSAATMAFSLYTNKTSVSAAGIEPEKKTGDKISIYPNPAIDNIVVQFSSDNNIPVNGLVSIVNLQGKIVLQQEQVFNPGLETEINVSSLAQGMYFCRVTAGDEVLCQKFIKEQK